MTPGSARTVVAGMLSTVAVSLPVFLIGSLWILMRDEVPFTPVTLGYASLAFYLGSAIWTLPAGHLAERFGAVWTTAGGLCCAAVTMLGLGLFADSVADALILMFIAGAGNPLAQLGANLSIATALRPSELGRAFGFKQSAAPATILLAGGALSIVYATGTWRLMFFLGAGLALLTIPLVPRSGRRPDVGTSHPLGRRLNPALLLIALAAGLASGGNVALGTFMASVLVSSGIDAGRAGLVIIVASSIGLCCRLVAGWLADSGSDTRAGPLVIGMMGIGAAGPLLLSTSGPAWVMTIGALLAIGLGWSWPGLLNLMVVRAHPHWPAGATSVTQMGVVIGGGGGPLLFGALTQSYSTGVALLFPTLALALAATLMRLAGGRRKPRDPAVRHPA